MHVRLCRMASRIGVSWSGLHQHTSRLARLRHSATNDFYTRPRDRFTRPYLLTMRRTICSSALAYKRCGRFTREGFQFHQPIINLMADHFRPGTLGDTHLRYILLAYIIVVKEQFIFALVCNIVDVGQLFTASK